MTPPPLKKTKNKKKLTNKQTNKQKQKHFLTYKTKEMSITDLTKYGGIFGNDCQLYVLYYIVFEHAISRCYPTSFRLVNIWCS